MDRSVDNRKLVTKPVTPKRPLPKPYPALIPFKRPSRVLEAVFRRLHGRNDPPRPDSEGKTGIHARFPDVTIIDGTSIHSRSARHPNGGYGLPGGRLEDPPRPGAKREACNMTNWAAAPWLSRRATSRYRGHAAPSGPTPSGPIPGNDGAASRQPLDRYQALPYLDIRKAWRTHP